jgi:membrane protease YdiL (CAAX protease family)
MRTLTLLGLVVVVLAATAVLSPWVAGAFVGRFTFARVYDRVFEVLLVVGVIVAWRHLDLGDAAAIGLARRRWAGELGRGLIAGLVGVAAGLVLSWLGGSLVPALRFPLEKTLRKVVLGLGAALAVGVGEEMLFRGVLLRRISRDAGTLVGVVATTAVYALVHAIRASGSGRGPVSVWAGIERTAGLVAPLADPRVLPGVAGLAGLGLVLAMARLRTGSLWVPIGVHAAWVAVFRVGRLFFDLGHIPEWLVGPGWPPLIGGVAGWAALAVTALLLVRR